MVEGSGSDLDITFPLKYNQKYFLIYYATLIFLPFVKAIRLEKSLPFCVIHSSTNAPAESALKIDYVLSFEFRKLNHLIISCCGFNSYMDLKDYFLNNIDN